MEEQDCKVFLHYVKLYLSPIEELEKQHIYGIRMYRFLPLNLFSEVDLLAFSLMPNHIHLLIKQHSKDGIIKFMRRLSTSYVMYFNKKYERVGSLFQNAYKAALIDKDEYLLHCSRYIHLNPIHIKSRKINFTDFSSYPYYLNKRKASWVKPEEILAYFKNSLYDKNTFSYRAFVEDYKQNSEEILGDITLEEE